MDQPLLIRWAPNVFWEGQGIFFCYQWDWTRDEKDLKYDSFFILACFHLSIFLCFHKSRFPSWNGFGCYSRCSLVRYLIPHFFSSTVKHPIIYINFYDILGVLRGFSAMGWILSYNCWLENKKLFFLFWKTLNRSFPCQASLMEILSDTLFFITFSF